MLYYYVHLRDLKKISMLIVRRMKFTTIKIFILSKVDNENNTESYVMAKLYNDVHDTLKIFRFFKETFKFEFVQLPQ